MSNSSMPEAFVNRMRTQLGAEYELFEHSFQKKTPVSIRINDRKNHIQRQGQKVPWATYGFYLNERPSFTLDPAFHGGAYYVQEASSMFLDHMLRHTISPSQPILALDLCAAPGGKSTNLLSALPQDSLLISNEVIRSRASILSENLQKWGYPNAIVTNNDPSDFGELGGAFDLMVIDAPCSGEGLFRRDRDAMNEWSEANVQLCSQRQQRIVSDVWTALKEGGVLVYSTCTYSRQENEDNLKWLKENYEAEFVTVPLDPTWGIREVKENDVIGYRFYPHAVEGEGFFISIIRKTGSEVQPEFRTKKTFALLPEKKRSVFQTWITESEESEFILQDDLVIMVPNRWLPQIFAFSQRLSIVTKGTAIATLKHDKPIPEHALALSIKLNRSHFETHDLSKEDALRYLRKENMEVAYSQKGFQLISYGELPLGWINHLGNRINNLYPVAWRIKMI